MSGVQLVLPSSLVGSGMPSFLQDVRLSINSVIAAGETTKFNVSATVVGAVVYYWFDMTITAAQSIGTVTTRVTVDVRAPQPQLEISPPSLVRDIVRGTQGTMSFTVTNTGGAVSGPLTVVLPGVAGLSLVSSSDIASIGPGNSTTVTVLMSTRTTDALGTVSGWIAVNGAYVGRSVSFAFGIVSNATGTLRVVAEDEFTFFNASAPRIIGAIVTATSSDRRIQVRDVTTDLNGTVVFANIPEAYYTVSIQAAQHPGSKRRILWLVDRRRLCARSLRGRLCRTRGRCGRWRCGRRSSSRWRRRLRRVFLRL